MRSLLTLLSLFILCLSALPSFFKIRLCSFFSDVLSPVRIVSKLVSAHQGQQQHEFRLDRLLKSSSTFFLTGPINAGSSWKDLQMRRLCATGAENPSSPLSAACNGYHGAGV
jgi:hypothetical protein